MPEYKVTREQLYSVVAKKARTNGIEISDDQCLVIIETYLLTLEEAFRNRFDAMRVFVAEVEYAHWKNRLIRDKEYLMAKLSEAKDKCDDVDVKEIKQLDEMRKKALSESEEFYRRFEFIVRH